MRAMQGAPKFTDSQSLPDVDYAAFARSLGVGGLRVVSPDEVGRAWDKALSADRPYVLDVHCSPDVPPIPPHATFEEVRSMLSSMASGDEDRWSVLKQGVRTKLQEFLPHRRE